MSTTKITSNIYKIDAPIRDVYRLLSDFDRIGRLFEMAKQMGMPANEQLTKLTEQIEYVHFHDDTCHLAIKKVGDLAIKIVEREEPKLIKLGGEGAVPFEFNLWIQLLDNGAYDTRLRLTFQGELNMVMKMLLKGKLEKGIDQFAESLTKVPYSLLANLG